MDDWYEDALDNEWDLEDLLPEDDLLDNDFDEGEYL